jgi:superfamily II DNA or RNA helicase
VVSVYLPPRIALVGKVAGNPVTQLDFAGRVEAVTISSYRKRGVKGWTLSRSDGENVLAVAYKTSANPFGTVLLAPKATGLPSSRNDAMNGYRWLSPKPRGIDRTSNLDALCAQVRDSWKGAFEFKGEERNEEDEIVQRGLRPPQLGALYAALAYWTVTHEVGTIVMPTGTGKTETMLALLAHARPSCLLVIVPTSALRDQIADKFLTFGVLQDFGVIGEAASLPIVGKMEHQFSNAQDASLFMRSCNVCVATMPVIGGCSEEVQQALASACTHLFIDEAHHTPAKTWNAFRERVNYQGKPILQFTATPFRRDGKHVGGKPLFSYPLRKAQEEGYFTPVTFISIWEYNRDKADEAIAARAVQALRDDLAADRDHLLMARTDNIKRAEQVQAIYKVLAPDLAPLVVHSEQKMGERLQAINGLHSRRSRIIVCVDMLGEGFDLPQLKVAALHDIHKSLAVTLQFVGRFTRTASTKIGEATVVANAADADVEEALEDLYAKDSNWNVVLRRLSEGATGRQRRRSEFIEGFQNAPTALSLHNVYPKMSMVAYKTSEQEWMPDATWKYLEKVDLLVEPTTNPTERVQLFITRERMPVVWGETKTVTDVVHHLYVLHWDERQRLLFINSTNNSSTHLNLAQVVCGDNVSLIRGEVVYRSLFGVGRLILSNLGLLHLLSRANQFTMHVGSDVKEGLSRAALDNRKKSNLFSRGYEGGESITIGASHKGRIWSQRVAEDIPEWVAWCQHVGAKLLDQTISTERILAHAIIPEIITTRPSLVPLNIEWPTYFYLRNEEAITIEIGGESVPFYQGELKITTFTDSGPLRFKVVAENNEAEYEVLFKGQVVEYQATGESVAYLTASGRRAPLGEWFQDEYPLITFEDSSKLEYNEIFSPKAEREPYDAALIEQWVWSGVDITQESQYKHHANPKRLEYRPQSVQRHLIERLLGDYGPEYDIIFDDDGSGEIADVVALRAAGDNLLLHLFHCKFSKSDAVGVRVKDFYEVCGQAQQSVHWRSTIKAVFTRLKLREQSRQENYGLSRFAKGDLAKLEELRRQSRALYPEFRIYIVQPGLDTPEVSSAILELLGTTELYLRETFDVPLTVIASSRL